jgi:glycosyltransferase involved in cell wall biosynthesis
LDNTIQRTPSSPPVIAALSAQINRPKWSVMIPVYNCYNCLEQNLLSVLAQDPGEDLMQIEVIDDASTDGDVEALVHRIGKGRVGYFRQPENKGSLRNFETAINRAHGHLIHLLHGDDFVVDGFYSKVGQLMEEYPEAGAAITEYQYVDAESNKIWDNRPIDYQRGILKNWLDRIGRNQLLQAPAVVVRRTTYEALGGFCAVHYGEDWEMWVRIAANYPVAYIPEVLAKYRVHPFNVSYHSMRSGQNIRDIEKVISLNVQHFPLEKRKQVGNLARRNFSEYYANIAHKIYHDYHQRRVALIQANGALRLHLNKTSLKQALKLYAKILLRYKRR